MLFRSTEGTDYVDKNKRSLQIGVDVLPHIPQDTTDRNRTSPVAFTGNKFEFRMPGSTPRQNARFLLFLAAFIKGVDDYQDFLRATVAFAGNDHRLGAQEAPPAVISIFLGDELNAVVESIIQGTEFKDAGKRNLQIGVDVLPAIRQDNTDRNRTSPMAFTGNKFEFRMLGSSQSISGPNIALNTMIDRKSVV